MSASEELTGSSLCSLLLREQGKNKPRNRKRHILDLLCQCRNVGLHDVMVCKCSQPERAAPLTLCGACPPLRNV